MFTTVVAGFGYNCKTVEVLAASPSRQLTVVLYALEPLPQTLLAITTIDPLPVPQSRVSELELPHQLRRLQLKMQDKASLMCNCL